MCDSPNRDRLRSELGLVLIVWVAWLLQVWLVVSPWLPKR